MTKMGYKLTYKSLFPVLEILSYEASKNDRSKTEKDKWRNTGKNKININCKKKRNGAESRKREQ